MIDSVVEDKFITESVEKINKAVSNYLDYCVSHVLLEEDRKRQRAELEILFYKYYEVYLEHDTTKPGFEYNVRVRGKQSVGI